MFSEEMTEVPDSQHNVTVRTVLAGNTVRQQNDNLSAPFPFKAENPSRELAEGVGVAEGHFLYVALRVAEGGNFMGFAHAVLAALFEMLTQWSIDKLSVYEENCL